MLGELPGILNWAIEGWHRLRNRDHFVQPESSRDEIEEPRRIGAPIHAFLEDECELGPSHEESSDTLFDAWCRWCRDEGRDRPGNKATFCRNLNAAVVLKQTQRSVGGKRRRFYAGIRLVTALEQALAEEQEGLF